MSIFDHASKELRVSRLGMHKLDETLKDLQSRSYTIISLTEEWQNLQNSFATIHNSLEERVKDVEAKEREVDSKFQKTLELEKSLSEVELREKQVSELRQSLNLEKKALFERCKAVELREKRCAECFERVKVADDEVKARLKVLEERECVVKKREEVSSVREKEIKEGVNDEMDSREKELKLKENVLQQKEVKLEDEMDEIYYALEFKEKEINEKSVMLEAKEKMLGLKEKEIDERCEALEAKEKGMLEGAKAMELKQKQMDERLRQMELKEQRFLALQTKEKESFSHQIDLILRGNKQINDFNKGFKSKENEFNDQLDAFLEKHSGSSSLTNVRQELPDSEIHQVACSIDSSLNVGIEIRSLCINMNAYGLILCLNKHVKKGNKLHEKILDALRYAPDPGKLVMEVSRSFNQNFPDKGHTLTNKSSCILLMEQLMKLSPPIIPELKEEAKHQAISMRAVTGNNNPADNFGFLQFVAAFKLASYFDENDLLSRFSPFYADPKIYRHWQQLRLCRALGLMNKIPGVINSLIERKKLLTAVKYICVFKMEHKFPPAPLLQGHLDLSNKKVTEKQKDGTCKSKIAAEDTELSFLRNVTTCIATFKLESKFSPDPLLSRIKELEKEKEERKPAALRLCNKRSASSCDSVASPKQLQKRPKVGNAHQVARQPGSSFVC